MKKCLKCKEIKNVSEFGIWRRSPDGLKPRCKQCRKEDHKTYYSENKDEILAQHKKYLTSDEKKERHRRAKEASRRKNALRLRAYLLEHPCIDCGEADPIVLEFDHVRGVKTANVANLIIFGWAKIAHEIEKCDVRCANCHRRKTSKERGWFSWMNASD